MCEKTVSTSSVSRQIKKVDFNTGLINIYSKQYYYYSVFRIVDILCEVLL